MSGFQIGIFCVMLLDFESLFFIQDTYQQMPDPESIAFTYDRI